MNWDSIPLGFKMHILIAAVTITTTSLQVMALSATPTMSTSEVHCCDTINVSSNDIYKLMFTGIYTRYSATFHNRTVYAKNETYLYWATTSLTWGIGPSVGARIVHSYHPHCSDVCPTGCSTGWVHAVDNLTWTLDSNVKVECIGESTNVAPTTAPESPCQDTSTECKSYLANFGCDNKVAAKLCPESCGQCNIDKHCCDTIEVSSMNNAEHSVMGIYTKEQTTSNNRAVYRNDSLFLYWLSSKYDTWVVIGNTVGSSSVFAQHTTCPGATGICPTECETKWEIFGSQWTVDNTLKVECIGQTTTAAPTTTHEPPCQDTSNSCETFLKDYGCDNRITAKLCQESCGLCNTKNHCCDTIEVSSTEND